MVDLSYFPGLVVLVIVEYLIVLGVIRLFFGYNNIFVTCDKIHESSWGVAGSRVLLIFRFIFFAYFLGLVHIHHDVIHDSEWWYFTWWNIYLIWIYYGLASLSSSLHLIYGDQYSTQVAHGDDLDKFIVLLYASLGATAFFVTLVAFLLLSAELSFWNISEHLVTSCSIIVEIIFNSLDIQPQQYSLCATWIFIYVVFSWAVVGSGLRYWPYEFLDTSTTGCYHLHLRVAICYELYKMNWLRTLSRKTFALRRSVVQELVLSE
eukprot:gene11660-24421_t